jgi:uncharacterized damage-inducible protein DinB
MDNTTLGQTFLKELEAEAPATKKCLERISPDLFNYKPHEKSMAMGYLAVLVAEVPKWLATMANGEEIDFATWKHIEPKTTEDLVSHFNQNMAAAKKALQNISDEKIAGPFSLKANGKALMTMPIKNFIGSSINHLVHHRGQLTVYMRLNNIPVPPIYGPSADEGRF